MATDKDKRGEIYKLLLSLLLARQGSTPIALLDQDYYEMEGQRIPWRKFGHTDLVDFLRSAPQHFLIESYNGGHYVRGIASDKSKHVSSLVARQKSKTLPFRTQRTRRPIMTRYIPPHRPRGKVPPTYLHQLVQHIKNNPDGVSMHHIKEEVQKDLPSMTITAQDLRVQLYELSHQLRIDGEIIYPVQANDTSQDVRSYNQPPLMPELQNASSLVKMCAGGDEESDCAEDFADEENFIPAGCISNNYSKPSRVHERLAANFALDAQSSEQNAKFYYDNNDDINACFPVKNDSINMETMTDSESVGISALISQRTRSRLKQLVEKHPQGIWCADLPDMFLKEYNVSLNYIDLGFTSVREYASYLPDIFHMTQENTKDDFLLYNADKKPMIPEETFQPNFAEGEASSREQHDDYYGVRAQLDDNDDLPIPADVSPDITKRFAPDNVMNYNDSVDCILVTNLLAKKKLLKAYVIEVFNPSFFWIQLWENKKVFENFMRELNDFYKYNSDVYSIPKVALKRGLNCACVYANMWHRCIIKSVKPDYRVTVLFYDFGTLKTYAPEDVYYLHKRFSLLPAQAIPCGLYNIRPIVGDRWRKSVNNQFIDRIDGHNGLLGVSIKSIDALNNSMLVVLTDINEDGETDINEWLVKENLAKHGKMVRMYHNFSFIHYLRCNITVKSSGSHMSNVVNSNRARYDKNQSISPEKAHKLSDIKSEDSEKKNVEDLCNIPSRKRLLLQKLQTLSSQEIVKSQSSLEEEQPKTLKPTIVQKLKSLYAASNSQASTSSSSKMDESFKDNSQQISSDVKVDVKSQDTKGSYCGFNVEFGLRDSDNEETTKKDFGTFHSLYGGQGSNEPFDWLEHNKPSCKPTATICNNNLDTLIQECKNDVEVKSESHNERADPRADRCFLNFTRKGEEYYSPEMNIEYTDKNRSKEFVARLRNKMQVYNDKCVQVTIPQHILEIFRHDDHSQDTPECNASTVKINGLALGSEETQVAANENDKCDVCETRADQKTRNNESPDLKLASCNVIDNENNNNNKTSEYNATDSSGSNTSKEMVNPRFKSQLLNRMRDLKMNSSKSSSSKESSSSSEQILSSSYSQNSSTDDIISSDNDQSKVFGKKSAEQRINKLRRFMQSASASSNNSKLSSDSDTSNLSSLKNEIAAPSITLDDSTRRQLNFSLENKSALPSNDSITQQLLNRSFDSTTSSDVESKHQLNQSLETDSNISSDESKNYQLNATLRSSKFLEMLKKVQKVSTSNSELDSDDLSNKENVESNKNCNTENDKSTDESGLVITELPKENANVSVTSKLSDNVIQESIPTFNDCDVESDDSDLDAFGEPQHFSFFEKLIE